MINQTEINETDKHVEDAKKCFACQKNFDLTFWERVKTTFTRDYPIECINCNGIFCSNCYKNEIRYSRKNPDKKGYSCNNCLEDTRPDSDVMFLPVNTVKDSLEDVKNQLIELKSTAEPILNNKIIPILNDTSELVNNTQITLDEVKKYLPELSKKINLIIDDTSSVIKKSHEKVEYIPKLIDEVNKLTNSFNLMLKLFSLIIALLVIGEILIIIKLVI